MQDQTQKARAAAFWMLHAVSLARLLRAHGRDMHASNLEAAMNEVAEIVSGTVGRQALAQAIGWAAGQAEESERPAAALASRH